MRTVGGRERREPGGSRRGRGGDSEVVGWKKFPWRIGAGQRWLGERLREALEWVFGLRVMVGEMCGRSRCDVQGGPK